MSLDYNFDDKYLFVGLTNGALKNENGQFVKHVNKIFDHNKREINKRLKVDRKLDENLYSPVVFNMFGDYDYAFYSLSDSYQFAAKSFRPYSLTPEEMESEDQKMTLPFQYQCLYGPNIYNNPNDQLSLKKLKEFATKDCMAICQIQLNNALVIGGGKDYLYNTIEKIRGVLQDNGMLSNLSLSYSWHEITISCFANNYIDIYEVIKEIRNLRVDIENIPMWFTNTLYKKLQKSEYTDPIPYIKETNTKFGFKYHHDTEVQQNIIDSINKSNQAAIDGSDIIEKINFITRIHAKPERVTDLMALLNDNINNFELYTPRHVSGRAALNFSECTICSIYLNTDIINCNFIRKSSSYLEFFEKMPKEDPDEHLGIQKLIFEKLEIPIQIIHDVRVKCKLLGFPKITAERVIRLLVNYNRNVADASLYTYFMELRSPVLYLIDTVLKSGEDQTTFPDINAFLDSIEKVFRNRYYHTPLFIYAGDTSTEHSGGVQQIISGYDYAAREITGHLYSDTTMFRPERTDDRFVNLVPIPGIKATEKTIQLNFYHLFQPALVASLMTHECFNFFFQYLVPDFEQIKGVLPIKKRFKSPFIWNKTSFFHFLQEICGLYIYFNDDHSSDDQETIESEGLYAVFYENVFRILIVDFATWLHAYKKNTELFLFWHLGNILQDSEIYENGKLREKNYVQISIRFYLLAFVANYVAEESSFDVENLTKSLASILRHGSNKSISDADIKKRLADYEMLSEIFIKEIMAAPSHFEDQLNEIINQNRETNEYKEATKTIAFLNSIVRGLTEEEQDRIGQEIKKMEYLDSIKPIKEFFNKILNYENENRKENVIIDLQYELLLDLFNEDFKDNAYEYFDFDHLMKGDAPTSINCGADMKFNPRGGGYTSCGKMRAYLMKKNSEFYMELWDAAQIKKCEEILAIPVD